MMGQFLSSLGLIVVAVLGAYPAFAQKDIYSADYVMPGCRDFIGAGTDNAHLRGYYRPAARLRLCSLLGVAIELPEFPLSFSVAIRRMGGFVLVVLAHSMQSPFCVGCFRSTGLRMEQLRELE
jgi:hypothetical protein